MVGSAAQLQAEWDQSDGLIGFFWCLLHDIWQDDMCQQIIGYAFQIRSPGRTDWDIVPCGGIIFQMHKNAIGISQSSDSFK